jgi:UDP-N-acetylmuramyl tripeptide synthase
MSSRVGSTCSNHQISRLLRRGLESSARTAEIEEIFTEEAAIARALDGLEPGDLLLILIDAVDTSFALVRRLLSSKNEARREAQPSASPLR